MKSSTHVATRYGSAVDWPFVPVLVSDARRNSLATLHWLDSRHGAFTFNREVNWI